MTNTQIKQPGNPDYRAIESWFKCRQTLIVSFNQLCLQKPFDTTDANPRIVKVHLDEFCQNLLDYVCLGQFNLFEKIAHHIGDSSADDGKQLKKLLSITQQAICFNDQYTHPKDYSQLECELSSLGEAIALRLEIEDELLNRYSHLFRVQTHPSN